MKTLIIALALSVISGSAYAQNVNTSSMTPVLTFPEPTPQPVTRDTTDK